MDFNVKKLAGDAGTLLSHAIQFTEENLGQAEKTEFDAHLENLLSKAECPKHWTEKIMKQTEVLLQPNPNSRIEEFVYEKLDHKAPNRMNNPELLGKYIVDSGNLDQEQHMETLSLNVEKHKSELEQQTEN